MSLSIATRWLRRPLIGAALIACGLAAGGATSPAQAQYYPYYAYNPYYLAYCNPYYSPYGCPTTAYAYPYYSYGYGYGYPYYGYGFGGGNRGFRGGGRGGGGGGRGGGGRGGGGHGGGGHGGGGGGRD